MEGQPGHIHLRDPSLPADYNLSGFGAPSLNYCPAGVYETVAGSKGNSEYKINAQNCLHCMACAIKEPQDNIVWTVPQGGDGPNYNDL
jgi:electron-transferring-flavoprotein dehydrogenase